MAPSCVAPWVVMYHRADPFTGSLSYSTRLAPFALENLHMHIVCTLFNARWLLKCLPKQNCFTNITSCYIYYMYVFLRIKSMHVLK